MPEVGGAAGRGQRGRSAPGAAPDGASPRGYPPDSWPAGWQPGSIVMDLRPPMPPGSAGGVGVSRGARDSYSTPPAPSQHSRGLESPVRSSSSPCGTGPWLWEAPGPSSRAAAPLPCRSPHLALRRSNHFMFRQRPRPRFSWRRERRSSCRDRRGQRGMLNGVGGMRRRCRGTGGRVALRSAGRVFTWSAKRVNVAPGAGELPARRERASRLR